MTASATEPLSKEGSEFEAKFKQNQQVEEGISAPADSHSRANGGPTADQRTNSRLNKIRRPRWHFANRITL